MNPQTTTNRTRAVDLGSSNIQNLSILDIEKENRLSRIIALYSKRLTESEIAQELGVDQSTESRDIQFIKQEANKKIEKYLNEDILFEYLRYIAESNEVTSTTTTIFITGTTTNIHSTLKSWTKNSK